MSILITEQVALSELGHEIISILARAGKPLSGAEILSRSEFACEKIDVSQEIFSLKTNLIIKPVKVLSGKDVSLRYTLAGNHHELVSSKPVASAFDDYDMIEESPKAVVKKPVLRPDIQQKPVQHKSVVLPQAKPMAAQSPRVPGAQHDPLSSWLIKAVPYQAPRVPDTSKNKELTQPSEPVERKWQDMHGVVQDAVWVAIGAGFSTAEKLCGRLFSQFPDLAQQQIRMTIHDMVSSCALGLEFKPHGIREYSQKDYDLIRLKTPSNPRSIGREIDAKPGIPTPSAPEVSPLVKAGKHVYWIRFELQTKSGSSSHARIVNSDTLIEYSSDIVKIQEWAAKELGATSAVIMDWREMKGMSRPS